MFSLDPPPPISSSGSSTSSTNCGMLQDSRVTTEKWCLCHLLVCRHSAWENLFIIPICDSKAVQCCNLKSVTSPKINYSCVWIGTNFKSLHCSKTSLTSIFYYWSHPRVCTAGWAPALMSSPGSSVRASPATSQLEPEPALDQQLTGDLLSRLSILLTATSQTANRITS